MGDKERLAKWGLKPEIEVACWVCIYPVISLWFSRVFLTRFHCFFFYHLLYTQFNLIDWWLKQSTYEICHSNHDLYLEFYFIQMTRYLENYITVRLRKIMAFSKLMQLWWRYIIKWERNSTKHLSFRPKFSFRILLYSDFHIW